MARGKSLNHKRKGHPGNFPEHAQAEAKDHSVDPDVSKIVSLEAVKNRVNLDR
ncbi:hypothetical protein V1498_03895 [Peribacillus sp. SCS-26]|uniref:hypothetical protein n=1 Tax=Paraperibacillus marinus TaxID=3115295 RepID=UPI003905FA01